MPAVDPADVLREAFVVLDGDEQEAWSEIVLRSGRLKVSRDQLLARARATFGVVDAELLGELQRTILKEVDQTTLGPQLAAVLCAGQLVQMFSGEPRLGSALEDLDAAALTIRVLCRGSAKPVTPYVHHAAQHWLDQRADTARSVTYPGAQIAALPRWEAPVVPFEPASLQSGFADSAKYLEDLVTQIDTAFTSVNNQIVRLQFNEFVIGEQQQIGWWLLSEQAAGQAGWEWAITEATQLASLTRILPPPRSAIELFRRRASRITWTSEVARLELDPAIGHETLSPILDRLSANEAIEWASPEQAAFAIYDEMLLKRMLTK
jgi:hypothetical protein